MRNLWLDSYVDRIIQRDSRDVRGTTRPERLNSLLRLVAANQSGELVKARLAQDAHLPSTSITAYLDVLTTLFLISTLPPWMPNLTKRELGCPKAVVSDSALAMRLDKVTAQQLQPLTAGGSFGGLVEGMVVSELLKQSGWSAEEYELFHFRDRDGLEVDLIMEFSDGMVAAIEVKASQTFKSDQFKSLVKLKEKLGDRFIGGFVLNTAAQGYQYADRLWGLPIASLWAR